MNRSKGLHAALFILISILFLWVRLAPLLEHRLVDSDSLWEGTQATYVAKTGQPPTLRALSSFDLLPNFLKQHVDFHQVIMGYVARITGFHPLDVIWWCSAMALIMMAILIYKCGQALFGPTAGLAGLFFVAVSPDSIRYGTHFGNNHFFALPLFLFALYALHSDKKLWIYVITGILAGLVHSFTLLIMIMLLSVAYAVEFFSHKRLISRTLLSIIVLSLWLLFTYNLGDWILLKKDLSANFDVSISNFFFWQGPVNICLATFALLFIFVWKKEYHEKHLIALGFIMLCTVFSLFHIFGNPPRYMTFLFPLHFFSGIGAVIFYESVINRCRFGTQKIFLILLMIIAAAGIYRTNIKFYTMERDVKGGFANEEDVNVYMDYSHGHIDISEAELEAARLLYNQPVHTSILASHWRRGVVFSFLGGVTTLNPALKKYAVDTVISGNDIEGTIDILRNPGKYAENEHVRISSRPRIHSPEYLTKHPLPYLEPVRYVVLDAGEGLNTWNGDDIKQTGAYRKFMRNKQFFEKIFDKSGVIVFEVRSGNR